MTSDSGLEVRDTAAAGGSPAPGRAPVWVPASLGWVLTVGGLLGFIAAGILSIEKYLLLTNPFFVPSCELGAALSCQAIMDSPQSALFGFPNPYIGLAAFPVVITLGVLTIARTPLPRWIWGGLLAGCVAGMTFVLWLIWQSLTEIQALCPYCMVVWVVTSVLLVQVARVVLGRGNPVARRHGWILAVWLLALAVTVVVTASTFG